MKKDNTEQTDEMQEQQSPKKRKFRLTRTALWAYCETIVFIFLPSIVLMVIIGAAAGFTHNAALSAYIGGMYYFTPFINTVIPYAELAFGCLVVVPIIYAIKPQRPIALSLWKGLKGNNIKLLLIGLLLGFAMNAVIALGAYLNGDIALSAGSFNIFGILIIFVFVFFQSAFEEIICRGLLYQLLRRRGGRPAVAIIGNALLFGALHLLNNGITLLSVINIVLVGILYSLIVYYFNSIWCAMAAHAAWNFTQNILLGLPNSGMKLEYSVLQLDGASAANSFFYDNGFGIEGSLACCLLHIILCAAIILCGRKRKLKTTDIWHNE